MIKAASFITWDETRRVCILHKKAVRSATKAHWYNACCANLVSWAQFQNIFLGSFTKRYLDEYLLPFPRGQTRHDPAPPASFKFSFP